MRVLSIEEVPLLVAAVVYRHGLALPLEPLLEDARGMDLGLLDASVVHQCEGPIFHHLEWAPDTSELAMSS